MSEFTFGTWYDISTAPKDGARILINSQWADGDASIDAVSWREYADCDGAGIWLMGGGSEGRYDKFATHWMPPPPPPLNGDRKPENPSTDECLNQSLPSSSTVEGGE